MILCSGVCCCGGPRTRHGSLPKAIADTARVSMSTPRSGQNPRGYNRPMPIASAVHARTLALAQSLNFREWSGYYAVSAYEAHHEHEYNAIRNAAALIDVSPLFKYI